MAIDKTPVLQSISKSRAGAEWLNLLAKTLRKPSGEEAFEQLRIRTLDDIQLDPIYPLTDETGANKNSHFRAETSWKTLSRIDFPDPELANKQLLADLEQGADGAVIVLRDAPSSFGFGVDTKAADVFDIVLANVFVDATTLRFEGLRAEHLPAWNTFCKKHNYAGKNLAVSLGLSNAQTDFDFSTESASTYFTADGADWHNRGASAAQELAFVLSQLVEHLRVLMASGINGTIAASMMNAKLSCDADQFETLSKLRAIRQLWAYMLEASGVDFTPLSLHAETSWRMMSRRDPWTNMLRTTLASFSAGLGGADSVTVLPHTQALGLPDVFARRVARNSSLVLQEESHLSHVVDPAAGAGLFDSFSTALAEKAWSIFQKIEVAGGWSNANKAETPANLTKASQKKRLRKIHTRQTISLGNSHFSKLDEKPVDVLIDRPLERQHISNKLPLMRDGQCFEQLAKRAKALHADSTAKVALICIGDSNSFKPKESFASDFFSAAGLASVSQVISPRTDASELATKETPIVCLCGSDEDYAEYAVEILTQIKKSGPKYCLLAGSGNFKGANSNIFEGSNAYETLKDAITFLEGVEQ
ncbi:MAG: methylmalonyl-CoA mutase family protein [Hyphomicrobiales bacterium]